MKISAIIIDDEPKARMLLKGMLQEFCPDVEVLAECPDLPTGVKTIRKLNPELVFLDIEMPGHSGLEIMEFFDSREVNFSIIFTTAYQQYAIQAFKLSAIDYLLKPIEYQELIDTIERFKRRQNTEKPLLAEAIENAKSDAPSKIALPTNVGIKFVELAGIVAFKADNSYTEVVFEDNTKILISKTLKNFEEALANNPKFFRCHKSYIVNVSFINDYIKKDGGYLVLNNIHNIPISAEKIQAFLEMNIYLKK